MMEGSICENGPQTVKHFSSTYENKFILEHFGNLVDKQQSLHEDEVIKVFGLRWNQNMDTLTLDL